MEAYAEGTEVTAIFHIQSSLAETKPGALVSEYSYVGKAKLDFATFSSIKKKVAFPHLF